MFEIKAYEPQRDQATLMAMIEREGPDWAVYSDPEPAKRYHQTLQRSLTYVAYDHDDIVAYVRALEDPGFYIYICDLLVTPKARGKGLGQALMETYIQAYPHHTVYVMSDVDEYYAQLHYKKEGSICEVKRPR